MFITDEEQIHVGITDSTGESKRSPHTYSPIALSDFLSRMDGISLGVMDHIGFDLPWFQGTRPDIVRPEKNFAPPLCVSLVADKRGLGFYLTCDKKEICSQSELNYSLVRRPKFEIVSISKVSTPIIQFEFHVHKTFQELTAFFPEAIAVENPGNVWVYIKNSIDVDICFVLNEYRDGDWGGFLKNNRI